MEKGVLSQPTVNWVKGGISGLDVMSSVISVELGWRGFTPMLCIHLGGVRLKDTYLFRVNRHDV